MAVVLLQDSALSTFTVQGELTPADVIGAYDELLKRGPTRLVLWDATAATVARIPTEDVKALAKLLAQLGRAHPSHGKTAIVCAEDVTFGMARMLGTFLEIEGFPGRIAVFWTLRAAEAWLSGGEL